MWSKTVDWFVVKTTENMYVLYRCCYFIYRKKYVNVKLPEILNYLIMKFQFLINYFKQQNNVEKSVFCSCLCFLSNVLNISLEGNQKKVLMA